LARRRHGEGSLFQRKDGRYVAQVKLDSGKKKQRYFKSEKEARLALRKMLHEKEQGTLPTGPQQTLKVYLDQWLEQVHKPAIRTSTYYMYRTVLDKHIIPALGHIRVQQLTPQQVQAFYASKLEDGFGANWVKKFHIVLHAALENAVRWNLVARNVCDLVTPPVPQQMKIQPLTPEQVRRLLGAARGHKLEALITLAVNTGMRRGELLGLHWQDIDFEAECLYVRRSVSRVGTFGIKELDPKTQRSKRKIELSPFVVETLKRHQEQQQMMREKVGNRWKEQGIVFCNRYGGYIEVSNLHVAFKQLLESAELPDIRFHDLRHSVASILLSMEVHPKVVQELLGHSHISITIAIYSHLFPSLQKRAINRLDDLFNWEVKD
jgi:integrase